MTALPDDRTLMEKVRQHDHTALAILYDRYGRQVYSLAYRVLQNTALAEEATQDTFMKVWERSTSWDANKGALISWLLTVTRYTAIDLLRAEQRLTQQNAPLEHVAEPRADWGIPHDPALQDKRALHELLAEIPTEQREVIELAFFQGLTHQKLAERLDLPLGTVKTRVRLGLQKLRELWAQSMQEEH